MKRTRIGMKAAEIMVLSIAVAVAAWAANPNKQLQEVLEVKYQLTKVGFGDMRITKPGTVLVLRQDGIYASPSRTPSPLINKVVNGTVEEPKGFGAVLFGNREQRSLKAGKTVYVKHIWVRKKMVAFDIITCQTYAVNAIGSTQQTRYAATVAFEFPEGTPGASAVEKAVDAVLLPQAEVQAAATKTIGLGQTPEQVKAILGAPGKIVNLGPKIIYIYKDMKVIFMSGKVSDVE